MSQFIQVGASGGSTAIALIGSLSALGGAVVGGFTTWWVQRAQLRHDDDTRFHADRAEVYAKFNGAARTVFARRSVSTRNPAQPPLDISQELQAVIDLFETITLIGSKPVGVACSAVHADIQAVMGWPLPNFAQVEQGFIAHYANVVGEMRKELGAG